MKKIRFPALILFLKRIVIVVGEAGFPFCNVIREAHGGTQGQCLKDYCMKYLVVLSVFLLLSGCKPDLENQVFGLIKNSNPDWRPNITEYRDSFIFCDERGYLFSLCGPHLADLSILSKYDLWTCWLLTYDGADLNFLQNSPNLLQVAVRDAPQLIDISALADKNIKTLVISRTPILNL